MELQTVALHLKIGLRLPALFQGKQRAQVDIAHRPAPGTDNMVMVARVGIIMGWAVRLRDLDQIAIFHQPVQDPVHGPKRQGGQQRAHLREDIRRCRVRQGGLPDGFQHGLLLNGLPTLG